MRRLLHTCVQVAALDAGREFLKEFLGFVIFWHNQAFSRL
jgi:hypothetical protein